MLKKIFIGSAFMEMLYKYYSNESEYAFKNLEKEVISFTPIESLNDPFEGIGEYVYRITPDEKSPLDSIAKEFAELFSEKIPKNIKGIVNPMCRIFSSSKDYDNPLLWAHYANSHKGFCVGYNKSDIEKISDLLQDINYASKLYNLNTNEPNKIENLLFTKSDKWHYENECRALYKLKSKDVEHLPSEIYYNKQEHSDDYIYDIPDTYPTPIYEILRSLKYIYHKCKPVIIYLGLRISAKDRSKLIRIANKLNIEVYQMTKSQHSFDLITQEIEPELINFILQTSQTSN